MLSVAAYFLELSLHNANSHESPWVFLWLERVLAIGFTTEYVIRFRYGRSSYATSGMGLIDFLSVVPFWAGFFVPVAWLGLVRSLRIIRLLKFFRYSKPLQMVAKSFQVAWPQLRALLFVFGVVLLLNIVLVYESERVAQPEFDSLVNCAWFVVVTSSTVGYGDISPVTPFGKLAVCVTLFVPGLAIFAAMLGTIGSAFANLNGQD